MPLATLDDACLAFGHVALLDHAALQIDAGERIALIGRNGSGKSSLLRILAGEARLDDGSCWLSPGLRVAFVPQEPVIEPGQSIFEAVASGVANARALLTAFHALTRRLDTDPDPALMEELHRLQAELEHADVWRLNTRVEQTELAPEKQTP